MGIVNLSPDSFSGDGHAEITAALEHAQTLAATGAEIIDLGAESARTNRAPITVSEEVERFAAFLETWNALPEPKPTLSLNTWRPAVVREILPLGGDLLNDISGLPDDVNARLCAEHKVGLVIMHTVGAPKVPHTHVAHESIWDELDRFFAERLARAESAGLPRDAIVLDPGIDFAKQRADNLTIYRELRRLQKFERPILLPVSRKTVIGDVLGLPSAAARDAGTQACIVQGILEGAQIFRVHNVEAARSTVEIMSRVLTEV
jgi:dihydropteroate synthase